MAQCTLPLATVLHWAGERGLTEAVVIGKDAAGKVHVASTQGTAASILDLTDRARADLDRTLDLRAAASDPGRLQPVR